MKKIAGFILAIALFANANQILNSANGHLYDYIVLPNAISWTDASVAAQSMGSGWTLATITSAEEQSFVQNSILTTGQGGNEYAWIGGLQAPNSANCSAGWSWVNPGEDFYSYTNWRPGEPNDWGNNFENNEENYLMILDNASQSYNGKWNDAPNSYYPVYGYVAEHSTSVPEPGILMSLLIGLVSLAGVSRLRRK